jgi:hypothetical protein
MKFDASIDLVAGHLPEGLPPQEGVRRARGAVEAVPGAGWVSVEWCGHIPAVKWIRLYKIHTSRIQVCVFDGHRLVRRPKESKALTQVHR